MLSSDRKTVKIWNRDDGTVLTNVETPADINDVCVAHDARCVRVYICVCTCDSSIPQQPSKRQRARANGSSGGRGGTRMLVFGVRETVGGEYFALSTPCARSAWTGPTSLGAP